MNSTRKYDWREPVFFLHIPKTAGESLIEAFRGWYGDRCRCEGFQLAYHDYLPRSIHIGHYNRNDQRGNWDARTVHPTARQLVTYLRDPFEQIVSLYFYWKNTWHGRMRLNGVADVPLADYASSLEEFLVRNPLDFWGYLPVAAYPEAFDEFLFVGAVEHFQICLDAYARLTDLPARTAPVRNRGTRDEPFDPALRGHYRQLRPDYFDAYESVLARWQPRWRSLVGTDPGHRQSPPAE